MKITVTEGAMLIKWGLIAAALVYVYKRGAIGVVGDAVGVASDWVYAGGHVAVETAIEPGVFNIPGTIGALETLNGPNPDDNINHDQATFLELILAGNMGA